jgi:DHA1 family multidrug/chloramphenicol efflux transport protein-like MFS transporter
MNIKSRFIGFLCFFGLYELTVYLTNDMVMPAMLQVVRDFHGHPADVGLSLSLYIVGGSLLQIALGPLAERYGERRILLAGNMLFLLATLAVPFCRTTDQFLSVRFVQGMGTCFVFIGYAVLHEVLDDVAAVKATSLLANMGIFAPLIGPVVGSALLGIAPWQAVFILAAMLAVVSLAGLWTFSPRRLPSKNPDSFRVMAGDIKNLLSNRKFLLGILISGLALAPLTAWIGLSPAIVMGSLGRSRAVYVEYQVIIFAGFVVSSLWVQRLADRLSMAELIRRGTTLALVGLLIAAGGVSSGGVFVAGMAVFSAGLGLFNGALLRMTMVVSGSSTRLASAVMSLLVCLCLAIGLEFYNCIGARFDYALAAYAWVSLPIGTGVFLLARRFVRVPAGSSPEHAGAALPA